MHIVDTHCHVSPYWYEPVETLLFQMDRNDVGQAVLIQYMGQYDNGYQAECVARYPERLGSVVLVDANAPDALRRLERLAEEGAAGVRLRADTRSPGDDPLAIWRKAEELRLPVSCNGSIDEFASVRFVELVEAFPHLPIVLEHLGSVNHPHGEEPPYEMRRRIFSLARFSNVYIKCHGLGEFCERTTPVQQPFPFESPIPPLLDMAYEAFGPERMMWGSDFPPVCGREGYGNALRLTLQQFASKSEHDRELIFGGVASEVFGLEKGR
ncbi:MAG: amidohydrolase family protein [Anaerolineales bacterium]